MKIIEDYEAEKYKKYYYFEIVISLFTVIMSIISIYIFEKFFNNYKYIFSLINLNYIFTKVLFQGFFILIAVCLIIAFLFHKKILERA